MQAYDYVEASDIAGSETYGDTHDPPLEPAYAYADAASGEDGFE